MTLPQFIAGVIQLAIVGWVFVTLFPVFLRSVQTPNEATALLVAGLWLVYVITARKPTEIKIGTDTTPKR